MKREERKIKKYKLDLSEYQVPKPGSKIADNETIPYPLKANLSDWLRGVGMFKTAEEVAEAVCLAKEIRDEEADWLILDEKEAAILTQAVDKLITLTADGKFNLGGIMHEEAICRVVNMEVIESGE